MLVVILDGCCVSALQRARTPFMEELAEKGACTFKCKSVFPSATYTAHASIITGVEPRVHGIVGNSFYDRAARRIIDFDYEDVNGYLLAETIFEQVDGLKIAVGEPITKGADVIVSKARVQEEELPSQDFFALAQAMDLVKKHKPRLMVVNLPAVDGIAEQHGPLSGQLLDHLKAVDEYLEALIRLVEELYEDHLVIILADHGMVEVHENINLSEVLEGLNYTACISHRAAHIYTFDEEGFKEAVERLSSDKRFQLVLHGEELEKRGVVHERCGDIVVAAREGYELGAKRLRGSHGGIASGEYYVPLIVSKLEYADLLEDADITVVPKIVHRYLREVKAVALSKEKLRQGDPAHEWTHTQRVLKLATELALKYKADVEAVRLSCILHDAERGLNPEGHAERAAKLAESFLKSLRASQPLIDKVKQAILKHHAEPSALSTAEEKILWDADKLDALGLVGLARCLMEEGFHGRAIEDAVSHVLRDHRDFQDKMHFPETRELALQKSKRLHLFLKHLRDEL